MGRLPFTTGLWLVVLFQGLPQSAQADEPSRLIAFYDPDANHQAILEITDAFNTYLKDSDIPLKLQPVVSVASLEKLLASRSVDFAIVSSAYLRSNAQLKPLLVPEADGKQYFDLPLTPADDKQDS